MLVKEARGKLVGRQGNRSWDSASFQLCGPAGAVGKNSS